MKNTMNSRDIAKFHKYLKAEVSVEKCSKALGVSKKILAKFTPEAIDKVKAKQTAADKPKVPATK